MQKKLLLFHLIVQCFLSANIKSCLLDICPALEREMDCSYLSSLGKLDSVKFDNLEISIKHTKNDYEPMEESDKEKYKADARTSIIWQQCNLKKTKKMKEAQRYWKDNPVRSDLIFIFDGQPGDHLKVGRRGYYEMFLDDDKVYVVDYGQYWIKQKGLGGSGKVMACVYDLPKKLSRQKIVSVDKEQTLDKEHDESSAKKTSKRKWIVGAGITGISLGLLIAYLNQKYGYPLFKAPAQI